MSTIPLFPQYPGGQSKNIYNGIIPIGGIILWSGALASLPDSWKLCDGNNGTIDLRDKFIICSGGLYNTGATGGHPTVTLDINEIPSHTHEIVDNGHLHGVSAPTQTQGQVPSDGGQTVAKPSGATTTDVATTGITIISTGGGAAHENMPPYYALAYIMRIS
jgi:microcystin-dependent protein